MKIMLTVSLAMCLSGCVEHIQSSDESEDQAELKIDVDGTTYTQTRVRWKQDGSFEVAHAPISLAQELAENSAREARATGAFVGEPAAHDPFCDPNSEWLYDQPNFVGNRICFSHPAFNCELHDLAQFVRFQAFCPLLGFSEADFWAGVPGIITGVCLAHAGLNVNRVRSIWTGASASPGVWFFDDPSLGGTLRSVFSGTFVRYPNVQTPGRSIWTCGSPLH